MNSVEAGVFSARAGFCKTYSSFYKINISLLGARGNVDG
jgi:hypothetical protein